MKSSDRKNLSIHKIALLIVAGFLEMLCVGWAQPGRAPFRNEPAAGRAAL
jgi:hypothetical protein